MVRKNNSDFVKNADPSSPRGQSQIASPSDHRWPIPLDLQALLPPEIHLRLPLPACRNLTHSFSPCKCLSLSSLHLLSLAVPSSLGKKVTVTLFDPRRSHVSFAIQEQTRSDPVLLLEFAISMSVLVREMSSGQVRIALECEKRTLKTKLFHEPSWTMYCNERKCGYVTPSESTELNLHVLRTTQNISVGAGVIPMIDDNGGKKKKGGSKGEVLYMRAKFERVVGNQDSEAYYMLNPDGNGGPELSIFLLRIWCVEEDAWYY